ncbi:glycosyltransferase family 2 protein [Haliea sp. E1-2-M8]|uniref:glycosyltransferase family 2 protein n=1 Tax=Haliea sp. E1-2-M8 TaxID=3064706 RepID=UPI0027290EA6|nr:glycosyltransferase family 2 protein [Haliea sp. E1-2-M8]MDO8863362.1 glycosyltransferase family 2 protein [Haliea sp. E1-2-M8]
MYLIITDFNGFEQTRICLQSLRYSRYKEYSVVLVDHGTSDLTARCVATEFPEVERISGSPDLWWAGATNLGVRQALAQGAERIMLLNNDCYVDPDTLSILDELAASLPDAVIAPVQRCWRTGEITKSVVRSFFLLGFPTLVLPWKIPRTRSAGSLERVSLISGGRGAIIAASVFEKVGLFDEQALPHYYADHDFFLRANDLGVPLYLASGASVSIDDTRTSIAFQMEKMSIRDFFKSLHSIRSHRNISAIRVLFRKHYPIPGLHWAGIFLYYLRYLVVYCYKRSIAILGLSRK